MNEAPRPATDRDAGNDLLKRELDKGLASGIGKRTPAQIRAAFRKARDAA